MCKNRQRARYQDGVLLGDDAVGHEFRQITNIGGCLEIQLELVLYSLKPKMSWILGSRRFFSVAALPSDSEFTTLSDVSPPSGFGNGCTLGLLLQLGTAAFYSIRRSHVTAPSKRRTFFGGHRNWLKMAQISIKSLLAGPAGSLPKDQIPLSGHKSGDGIKTPKCQFWRRCHTKIGRRIDSRSLRSQQCNAFVLLQPVDFIADQHCNSVETIDSVKVVKPARAPFAAGAFLLLWAPTLPDRAIPSTGHAHEQWRGGREGQLGAHAAGIQVRATRTNTTVEVVSTGFLRPRRTWQQLLLSVSRPFVGDQARLERDEEEGEEDEDEDGGD
ncbi:hypothetical protein C8F01DRAFT_1301436 [Mycena amicta]|nr:hypothetical protein C8F01DRAFT_1301436 [Mycena amicta]